MNRKQRRLEAARLKKDFNAKSRAIEEKISKMPDCCDECGAKFNKNDSKILDSWKIAVYDTGEINLICEKCTPGDISTIFKNDPIKS